MLLIFLQFIDNDLTKKSCMYHTGRLSWPILSTMKLLGFSTIILTQIKP